MKRSRFAVSFLMLGLALAASVPVRAQQQNPNPRRAYRLTFSLSEARVMYELAHTGDLAAKEIGLELGLDPGYLSRIIQKFDENGLVTRKPLPSDRRQYQLSLTAKGRASFAKLERTSQEHVGAMLGPLSGEDRTRLSR